MLSKKIFIFSAFLLAFTFIQPVFAYKTIDSAGGMLTEVTKPTGISTNDLQTSTGNLIKSALALVGTVFLGLMIYGGFMWMTARGSEDQITKGKETIIAALIGIGVILGAFAITSFVTNRIVTKPQSSGNACSDRYATCLESCQNEDQACFDDCDNRLAACS